MNLAPQVQRITRFWHAPIARVCVWVLLFAPLLTNPASAADVAALIRQLDRTEWEIVSDEVKKRLPNLVFSEQEQASFRTVLQTSQEVAGIAEALNEGRYDDLGALSARILARDIDQFVVGRFGKDSRLYRMMGFAKKNSALTKELTRAALNLDARAAARAIRDALEKHARDNAAELQKQGQKFWKDLILEVTPGGRRLSGLGLDPVDLYLKAVRNFRDFTKATRLRFNNSALDCLALRYRGIREKGGSQRDARIEVENFGTGTGFGSNFDCAKARNGNRATPQQRSIAQSIADFFARHGRSTAAQGNLNLTRSEIVTLIEKYEASGAHRRHKDFSEWLEERLIRSISTRAERFESRLIEEQRRVTTRRIGEAKAVMTAIETEIARLDRKKQEDRRRDTNPRNQPSPSAGTTSSSDRGNRSRDRRRGDAGNTGRDQPRREKPTAACDNFRSLVANTQRRLNLGRADAPDALATAIATSESKAREEGNCPSSVFADASTLRSQLQQYGRLRDRFRSALRSCNVGALSSLRGEARSFPRTAFLNEVTLLQTAKTGVETFTRGRAASDKGNYDEAERLLNRAKGAFDELPNGACQTYRDRTRSGLEFIAKVRTELARITAAINRCDMPALRKMRKHYAQSKNRFARQATGRVRAALKDCRDKNRVIQQGRFCEEAKETFSSAAAAYRDGRLLTASSKLSSLSRRLTKKRAALCLDLISKVQRGLEQVGRLNAEADRLSSAIRRCDVQTLQRMASSYSSKNHQWFTVAARRARNAMNKCRDRPVSRSTAIAECKRKVAGMGKVYATTKFKSDGSYSCHWCNSGFVARGSSCVPDVAKAERQCQRLAASNGKVHARAVVKSNGTFNCLWCERGQIYQNGQCGTWQAFAEQSCRQQAARRGKVYATTRFLSNRRSSCHWCEPGQYYATDGRCWPLTALAVRQCQQQVARMGKVFGTVVFGRNGQYNCVWCHPGHYFANGRCYSRQRGIATGAAILSGVLNELQRQQRTRRQPQRRVRQPRSTAQRRPTSSRTQRRPQAAPPRCIRNGFVNMTDPRCKRHWR